MTQVPDTDREFERTTITKVRQSGDGWEVQQEEGWSLWYTNNGIEPEVGDTVRYYGRGFGYVVRGIVIEGKGVVRYESKSELAARHEVERATAEQEKQDSLGTERPDRDLRIRELPRGLRLRIEGFQGAKENWRRDYEPYELFVCEQAAAFAAAFWDGENSVLQLNDWSALPFKKQQEAMPILSDQHSGNTFGMAVQLARLVLLEDDDLVIQAHGAMCPLVGCEDYGCVPARVPA